MVKSFKNYLYLKEEASDHSDGVMIAYDIPIKLAKKLALDNYEKPDQLHLTIVYLGKIGETIKESDLPKLQKILKTFCEKHTSIEGSLNCLGRFPASKNSESKDVIHLGVSVKGLVEMRNSLVSKLEQAHLMRKEDYNFHPHVTLAYISKSKEFPIKRFESKNIRISDLSLHFGGKIEKYNLQNKLEENESLNEEFSAEQYWIKPDRTKIPVIGSESHEKVARKYKFKDTTYGSAADEAMKQGWLRVSRNGHVLGLQYHKDHPKAKANALHITKQHFKDYYNGVLCVDRNMDPQEQEKLSWKQKNDLGLSRMFDQFEHGKALNHLMKG